ncbi:MAG TPA: FecR domain-containing protein [Chryseosolibacter sp.]|nr:FecR domain-containing protein [Chryseosolibacter sp.]
MISEKDLERILDRYLKGTATEQEIKLIEKWYDRLDAENGFPRFEASDERSQHKDDLLEIKKRLRMSSPTVRLWPALLKIAAVVLMGLALVYFFDSASLEPRGEQQSAANSQEEIINNKSMVANTILLPDSTLITLQPNSAIRFSKDDFNIRDRQVTLEGTASFEVSHDATRPFKVFSYDVVTTVLGTSFTIQAPSSETKITVAVQTGRVSVAHRNENNNTQEPVDEIIVTPNQQVIFDPEEKDLTALLVPHPLPLQQSKPEKVVFDEEPIANILHDIGQVFGIEIEYNEELLRACRITTAFSDEDLYERLDILTKAIGATYSVEGTKIRLRSNGCSTH